MAVAVTKSPTEVQDYEINWAAALGTDTIASSSWSTTDPTLICDTPGPTYNATTTTVWLSGGVPGITYIVTNTVTTNAGRTMADSFPTYITEYNFL